MTGENAPVRNNNRPLVLVVDEEPAVIRMLTLELSIQGFDVVGAAFGEDTFRSIEKYRPDIVVMEVMLPGLSGYDVLGKIKQRYQSRVIFLTTQGTDADRSFALELGADDYLSKPFMPGDLAKRINLVLNRAESTARHIARFDDLEIDFDRRLAHRDGTIIELTTNEWALLFAIVRQRRTRVAARDLLIAVWGAEYASDMRFLEVWIARMRRKLEENPDEPRVIVGDVESGFAFGSARSGQLSA